MKYFTKEQLRKLYECSYIPPVKWTETCPKELPTYAWESEYVLTELRRIMSIAVEPNYEGELDEEIDSLIQWHEERKKTWQT